MNIPKAIEILILVDHTPPSGVTQDFKDALKLGIEALEETARARRLGPPLPSFRLPGETKD